MKMPSFEDIIESVNPWSETHGALARMNDARHESDQLAMEQKRGAAQIGPNPQSKILEQRPTFRHVDQARPDFTKRVRWLLGQFIGNHVAFTHLDKFPNEQTVEQQAQIIYERISAVLWGPGQRGRADGEMVNVRKTREEVLGENLRTKDDFTSSLVTRVRQMLARDSQLHFMTKEQAAERDAENLMRMQQINADLERF